MRQFSPFQRYEPYSRVSPPPIVPPLNRQPLAGDLMSKLAAGAGGTGGGGLHVDTPGASRPRASPPRFAAL